MKNKKRCTCLSIGIPLSRDVHFIRILKMLSRQTVFPSQITLVVTFEYTELLRNALRSKSVFSLIKNVKLTIIRAEYGSISKSRNLILDNTKEKYLIFFDDDVYFSSYFTENILRSFSSVTSEYGNSLFALAPVILPKGLLINKLSVYAYFMWCLYHSGIDFKRDFSFKTSYGLATMLLDLDVIKKYSVRFDETVTSGEDILFLERVSSFGKEIVIDTRLYVFHDFVNSFNSFLKKIYWYSDSGVMTRNNDLIDVFKPERILHVVFYPFFFAIHLFTQVKRFYFSTVSPRLYYGYINILENKNISTEFSKIKLCFLTLTFFLIPTLLKIGTRKYFMDAIFIFNKKLIK